jgi:tetratricopeptide (TPR) repeat protein/serine/threonine protein kinase
MNAENDKLRELFLAALKVAAGERDAYLSAACAEDGDLRERAELLIRAHEELGTIAPSPQSQPNPTVDQPPAAERPGTVIGPYKLLEKVGEGGMGTVWMAEQKEPIQRRVALKVIKAGMDSKQVLARFEAERQALALMDHPNIARVLDAGTIGSPLAPREVGSPFAEREGYIGRPYFVMELVKGTPITNYCDDKHLTVRERLEIFRDVCRAVQHAHQKGIIHRDLKPSNILIAPFDGKPVAKVIDFGVAKATGQRLTDATLFTGFGAVVGTPEYMSPEQAETNNQDIDTRSDIYSLGVLLYELLTGSTPLTRKRVKEAALLEVLRVIREEEPPRPSTRLSSTEELPSISAQRHTEPTKLTRLVRGELDWIVMKALEKDRNRRYETANGFAMDVQRYLADEPVLACPPSAGYRLRKFARRHKAGLAVAGLVLLFLVLLGTGLGWAIRDRLGRQAKLAGQVELILAEVDRLEKEQKYPEALAAARRAEAATAGGEADSATAEQVCRRLKELKFIDRLERIRMQRATTVEGTFNDAGADRAYAVAFRHFGVDVEALAARASIDRLQGRPALAIPLAAALDDWVFARRILSAKDAAGWKRLVAVARGIDPEPLRAQLRAAWGRRVSEARDELRGLAESINVREHHPATIVSLARTLRRVHHSNLALRLLRNAQFASPGDFWLNFWLGFELVERHDYGRAIRFYAASVSIRPKSALAHRNLAIALTGDKQLDEAVASFHKALDIDPKCLMAHYNLGNALRAQHKPGAAAAAYRRAIALTPTYALVHCNLGVALAEQNKWDAAAVSFREAIKLDPKCFLAHAGLGKVLRVQKKWDAAAACFRRALAIKKAQAAASTHFLVAELNPPYADSHYGLGFVLGEQGHVDQAITHFHKAIELDPQFFPAHTSLGFALIGQKQWGGAGASFRRALDIKRADAAAHGLSNPAALDGQYARAHYGLGFVLGEQGHVDQAITHFHKAIELNPKLADAHYRLGSALLGRKKLDEAIASYKKAVALEPKAGAAHYDLGCALVSQGNVDEAITHFRQATKLEPKSAAAYSNLGTALLGRKKLDEAIAAYQKASALDPKDVRVHFNLGLALRSQANAQRDLKKLDKAVAAYQKASALDPKYAGVFISLARDYCRLGNALRDQKEVKEAVAAYQKAIALDPKNAYAHYVLGVILCDNVRDYEKAAASFRKVIELRPHANAYISLGNALRGQKKPNEAVAAYRKANQLDPKNACAHYVLGDILCEQKKLDESMAAYRKASELDPKYVTAYIGLASHYCNLGDALRGQRKLNEAVVAYQKAMELNPKLAGAHDNLGCLLCDDRKEYDKAIACFRTAIKLDPKQANTYRNLSFALTQKGWALANCPDPKRRYPKRAVEALEEAVAVDPPSSMAWQYLGWAQYRAGNWQASIEALEKSCKLQKGGTGDAGQWVVLALAHTRLAAQQGLTEKQRAHHRQEARRRYEQADKQIDRWWRVRPGHEGGQAIWDFRAEARELMIAKESKK